MVNRADFLGKFGFLFAQDGGYLRVPIWGHIPLSSPARRIIEHPSFARLSGIRQLGFVHYVFPGATHTRFEHSIGVYHISTLILQRLLMNPVNWEDDQTPKISPEEARIFLASALLHDIGHFPFAHMVDRLAGPDGPVFESHEARARSFIMEDRSEGSIYSILKNQWRIDEPERVADVIARPNESGLPGRMLSGILDPDKMDYLMRDASACGVPYGNIDTDRLIEALVLDVDGPRRRLGITEKGVAPLESLVFAKYMMFRHIYWHHAVRIAFAMFTRFVQDGFENGCIDPEDLYRFSDDALIEYLCRKSEGRPEGALISSLKSRELYKRGITFYPEHASEEGFALTSPEVKKVRELYWHPDLRRDREREICDLLRHTEKIDLIGFEALLDIPRLDSVFDVKDFKELHVLADRQAQDTAVFVPFNSFGFTQLTAQFAQEFERFSRRVQIVCRPDLRQLVARHLPEIRQIITS